MRAAELVEVVEVAERVAAAIPMRKSVSMEDARRLACALLDLERDYHKALGNCAELRAKLEQIRRVVLP